MSSKSVNKSTSDIHTHSSKKAYKTILTCTPLLVLIVVCSIIVLVGYNKFLYAQGWTNMIFGSSVNAGQMDADNPYKRSDAPQKKAKVETSDSNEHEIIFPYYGDAYAKLTIDNPDVGVQNVPVYWGDGDDILEKGIAQSNYSSYIGVPGRVVLAAHNHTFFVNLKNIKPGDKATLATDYGTFVYKVTKTDIKSSKDSTYLYYDPTEKPVKDDLILYTCWNNGYMGASEERLYVICEVVNKTYKN